MKKIVLITTTQPAANPRLVKEADTFAAQGYDVTVLYCFVADWAQEKDKFILKNALWKSKQIGGCNKSSSAYFFTALKFAFYKFINKTFTGNFFCEQAHTRCYSLLLREAIKLNADWYIGHNPGAMGVAANASTHTRAKAGFDFEDYHRGEYADKKDFLFKRQVFLENKYFRDFYYISTSSPLITEKILRDFKDSKIPVITLLNTFSLKDQPVFRKSRNDDILKLFWMGQHLGKDRGLENVILALKELNDPLIQLTLVGNCTKEMYDYFMKLSENIAANIHFTGIIAPEYLPKFAAAHDIGLALELSLPENRNICLTNKIFTYLLAGNAIIFSETDAQLQFNLKYNAGFLFPPTNVSKLKNIILYYKDQQQLLRIRKSNHLLAAQSLNWEIESMPLNDIIAV